MSYANWFGVPQTIPSNTLVTNVTQNGSNYVTSINAVPTVISRNGVLSTMKDEAITTFFTASNVPPGLYKVGFYWNVGTGAGDPWQAGDYYNFFVATKDYLNNTSNSNAQQLYKSRTTSCVPFTEGVDPVGSPNGSVTGIHQGFVTVSSIQNLSFCAYLEDFSDNPTTHTAFLADPFIQKIG